MFVVCICSVCMQCKFTECNHKPVFAKFLYSHMYIFARKMRLGYACINLQMQEEGVYCTRGMILKTANEKGHDYARKVALENCEGLLKTLMHNEKLGLRFFRITSNLFPHMGNPRLHSQYDISFAAPILAKIGKYARDHAMRLTMHPGQFVQLGSNREDVVEQSFTELTIHADIFRAMGMTPQSGSVMIIHGGGVYGDKLETLRRWKRNFKRMPEYVRSYIAVENDEFSYSVMDLLPVCEELSIPLCVDFFHHSVQHSKQFNIWPLMNRVLSTWKLRGIKPKCHLSQQRPDSRPGTHSDCVDEIPSTILDFAIANCVDIMLEVKQKDKCLMSILERDFTRVVNNGRVEWYPKK
jgi:UV DNA damage endonuclease